MESNIAAANISSDTCRPCTMQHEYIKPSFLKKMKQHIKLYRDQTCGQQPSDLFFHHQLKPHDHFSSSNSGSSLESICIQNIHWAAGAIFPPSSFLGSPCHDCGHCLSWLAFSGPSSPQKAQQAFSWLLQASSWPHGRAHVLCHGLHDHVLVLVLHDHVQQDHHRHLALLGPMQLPWPLPAWLVRLAVAC